MSLSQDGIVGHLTKGESTGLIDVGKSFWAVRVINEYNVYCIRRFMEWSLHMFLAFITLSLDWMN